MKNHTAPQIHPIPPLYNQASSVLILGSFPSVKSREAMFFYGHPQNRFWKVVSAVAEEAVPQSIEEKKRLILSNNLALWDVLGSCTVTGSSDSSIKDAKANDISIILNNAPIEKIFCNGGTALKYYNRLIKPVIGREAVLLPSTSPANAAWSLERLIRAWEVIIDKPFLI